MIYKGNTAKLFFWFFSFIFVFSSSLHQHPADESASLSSRFASHPIFFPRLPSSDYRFNLHSHRRAAAMRLCDPDAAEPSVRRIQLFPLLPIELPVYSARRNLPCLGRAACGRIAVKDNELFSLSHSMHRAHFQLCFLKHDTLHLLNTAIS